MRNTTDPIIPTIAKSGSNVDKESTEYIQHLTTLDRQTKSWNKTITVEVNRKADTTGTG